MSKISILVTGHGKSGSKRLLRIFDLSPRTHCRMEPMTLRGSPFFALPSRVYRDPSIEDRLRVEWDVALEWARRRQGEKDPLPPPPKDHLHGWSRTVQLWRLVQHNRLRRTVGRVFSPISGAEWLLPSWLGNRERLLEATPVFKIGQAPAWIPWVLEQRGETRVAHVVRHPGGFLHSYYGRFLPGADPALTEKRNRSRLRRIIELEPHWAKQFGDVDTMSLQEAELWYWRYANEIVFAAGAENPRFLPIRDDELLEDPVGRARELYGACELDWGDHAEAYLARRAPHWAERRAPWRELLDADDVALVERILDGSSFESWWGSDQVVSHFDYTV